ncbi:methyl-accepting chemotaxis protein [Pararhizobium capsulatum DSM 1112]|uniref:Methyl-accepting chemotaxis protein n=1 Tax=Pararhizobium capsulatum DSM 1112 TaxID=1121113 RepID=A0ABU0BIT4_9HYPH|nr:methyl-accepting chemotaxis protein [Pararhizobium capsulatum]MDQ0318163.1 methyl-accepting chemotaxis protein [Pararhizobium capsulatum DSM 1112]
MNALYNLRRTVSSGILALLWIDVAVILLRNGMRPQGFDVVSVAASVLIAGVATACWMIDRTGPTTRLVSSMAHAAAVAVLVYTFSGSSLQIDMHMYFFATLAICAAWIDWRAILGYTAVVATHHLALYFVLPWAVFPEQSDILRVVLHAAILVLESGVLVAITFALTSALLLAEKATEEATAAQLRGDEIAQQQIVSAKAEMERIQLAAEKEADANDRRNRATESIAGGLRRLASGELCFELSDPLAPEFEAIRHDLNTAVNQLGKTLRAVNDTTVHIDDGTREFRHSADDLSRRTEHQAASLEETAAALDQITANVTNSSRRTEEARSVARQANESAAHSGAVVSNAVNAMQRIEHSSSQISNIIGVIDEIAFQTNLLALNAGVEAARAGEAGKGFAVVAQEVRELAQRSAQAAREIKELIRNSTEEVQTGVRFVSETGEALKTIEGYIVTINMHMDAIATSAKEQSMGLAEVNSAVNKMDQVTQQNAAMVEETNAASAILAKEAGRLRLMIGQFQLGDMAGEFARTSQKTSGAATFGEGAVTISQTARRAS